MPEEAPTVQNWKLLIVACVLGLVVMVVYNLHISKIKAGLDQEKVTAFRYARDIDADEVLKENDLIREQIPKKFADSIGRLLGEEAKDSLGVGRKVRRGVSKGEFAMMAHFVTAMSASSADDLRKDYVAITIAVDSKNSVGRVLRIGNHVNIRGVLPGRKNRNGYETYRIIEWLRVVAIGGQTNRSGQAGSSRAGAQGGVRSFSTITVEVRRRPVDVSLQWGNLKTHLRGPATIEICPSRYRPKEGTDGVIADELKQYTTKAADVSAGGSGYDDGI
ncbi:MAG: RcpC/CpaB family pilus assembly protein [Phycisphaerae bacterium]|jgi:Flp pilus assembly protein CpaB|nr:RcpC/CpaB family pilus assembly protein [Phycisphaerae bacterium]